MKDSAKFRWIVLTISFLAQLSNALAAQAVAPLAAPIFQPELGINKAEVGFFSAAAFAGAWGVWFIAGYITDRFGVRRVMATGQLITGALVLCMSSVGSFLQAVAVMFAAGLGRGLVGPGVSKSVMDWFPQTIRATAMGINQAAIPLAGIFAASTLPALALTIGWRSAIAVVGFAILACGIATASIYREQKQATAIAASTPNVKSNLKVVLQNRRLWVVSAMGPILSTIQFTATTYLALYYKEILLVTQVPDERTRVVVAGAYLAVFHAGSIVARVVWGIFSDRVLRGDRIKVLAIISALSMVMSVVVSFIDPNHPLWLLAAIAFAYGATGTGWQGLHLALAAETSGTKYAGTGVGLCMTFTQLGNVAGPPLFGVILDTTDTYKLAWLFLGALSAIATTVACLLARNTR